jgi:hypothetical protein
MNVAEKTIQSALAQDTERPNVTELRARLTTLKQAIASRAQQVEKDGRVPMESIDALRAAGYFDIVRPRAFGGLSTTSRFS